MRRTLVAALLAGLTAGLGLAAAGTFADGGPGTPGTGSKDARGAADPKDGGGGAGARPQRTNEVTPASLQSAQRGIDFLLKSQHRSGYWGVEPGAPPDVATTCMVGLALLGSGDTPTCGRSAEALRRATDFVIMSALDSRTGEMLAGKWTWTIPESKLGHRIHIYFATMFLSQVLGASPPGVIDEASLREALAKLAARVDETQLANGSWLDQSPEPLITTVLAWMALRSAFSAGITVRNASVDRVLAYVKSCYDPKTATFSDSRFGSGPRYINTTGSLRVLYGMGEGDSPEAKGGQQTLLKKVTFAQDYGGSAGGEDYLAALFAVEALQLEDGDGWAYYWPRIRDQLVKLQNADGSWTGHHCITGRVFCTATAVQTLQMPYRYLPLDEH